MLFVCCRFLFPSVFIVRVCFVGLFVCFCVGSGFRTYIQTYKVININFSPFFQINLKRKSYNRRSSLGVTCYVLRCHSMCVTVD